MLPEEIEASRNKYIWKSVYRLDELHNELASCYKHENPDQRRIALIWQAIDTIEISLKLEGIDYEQYTTARHQAAGVNSSTGA